VRNREYWQKRFSAVEEMRNKRGRLTVDQIVPHFDRAQASIDKEIRAWYQRFADNNEISVVDAKKLLKKNELEELQWDVSEYIKRGRENAVSQEWLKELENASAKFHISRLEALKLRAQNAAEQAFAAEQNKLTECLTDTWKQDYYHTAYEMQKGFRVGFDVAQVDNRRVTKLLDKPWTADQLTFSDRIWKSKAQLLDSVSTELTQMCILGKAPDEAINNIAKRMNVAKSQAGRLVMTENAYFGSAAQKQCYKDLDVEQYQIIATLDSRTSDICRHFDGKVFDMKDYEPGVTAPPFHVYCRSCTVPYFADNDDNGMRAARDENGKTYYVPANTTYAEWEKAFAGGGKKDFFRDLAIRGQKIHDIPVREQNVEVPKEILSEVDTAIHKLSKEFPSVDGNISGIKFCDTDDSIAAAAINRRLEINLKLNENLFSNTAAYRYMLKHCDSDFSPKSSLYDYLKHEFTHFAEYQYAIKANTVNGILDEDNAWNAIRQGTYAKKLLEEALSSCALPYDDGIIKTKIGLYATQNASEAIAEAVSTTKHNDLCDTIKRLVQKKWK
jgi:SPP1 gp7 family putative phage head morphogenesis protein